MISPIKIFQNWSINKKLIMYFMTYGILIAALIGLLLNWFYSSALKKSYFETARKSNGQVNVSIDSAIQNFENALNIIAQNPQVIEFLRTPDTSSKKDELLKSNIRSFLSGFEVYYFGIESISIVGANETLVSNEYFQNSDIMTQDQWYLKSINNPKTLIIENKIYNKSILRSEKVSTDDYFSIIKAIVDPSSDQPIGVILIELNKNILKNIINEVPTSKDDFIYIIDQEGRALYSPINRYVSHIDNDWFSGERTFSRALDGQIFQLTYTSSFYTKWKIISVISNQQTLREVITIRFYLTSIIAFVLILSIPISFSISSTISNPIKKLRSLMKNVESGDLSVRFDAKYNDEIGDLGRTFNSMVQEINILLEEVQKESRNKRKAELAILQSQIKPHFLYNTLDTIHWMCKKYKADDIITLVNALTKLFRIALSKGLEKITLSEEIEHVKSYLIIQKFRYEDILDYEIFLPKELEKVFVQKLILQPVVENAIYHGIKPMRRKGKITIRCLINDGDLLICVYDDGKGISQTQAEALNRMFSSQDSGKIGYGLYNVNERIRLTYGPDYHLTVQSGPENGTEVQIRHPLIYSEVGEGHV